MSVLRRTLPLIILMVALFILSACSGETTSESGTAEFVWQPLFGDGTKDNTAIIAKVGEAVISERNLELFLEGLPSSERTKYNGPDGERLALKKMVELATMVQGAVAKELYNDQDVARTLITQRRVIMDGAMRNYGLLRGVKPDEAMVRKFYLDNKANYRQLGVVRARHVECLTEEEATKAYDRLNEGGRGNDWANVLKDHSVNEDTKKDEGELGWFNQGGFIAFIRSSQEFIDKVFDMPVGFNPPIKVSNRWHVVHLVKREPERGMTFTEAKAAVEKDLMPAFQDAIIQDYLLEARKTLGVEMLGRFAPGQGLTAEQLVTQAMSLPDAERSLELLNMVHTDYPDSPQADNALFLAATISVDRFSDQRIAARYLTIMLDEYPDSELVEDARYLLENLYNPRVMNPESIEDLRKQNSEGQ